MRELQLEEKPTCSFAQLKSMMLACGIVEEDIVSAVKYFQNLGLIVYFDDEKLKVWNHFFSPTFFLARNSPPNPGFSCGRSSVFD